MLEKDTRQQEFEETYKKQTNLKDKRGTILKIAKLQF